MTAKQELIAAAWKANPNATSVQIVETLKAGGTEVSKSSVDNMKKELGLVATGQRGRKKANPTAPTAPVAVDTASTETPRPAIVFANPSDQPEWIEGTAAVTASVAVTPVAPVIPVATPTRRAKKKASKPKPKTAPVSSPLPTLAAPEPFDGVVRQYADQCVAYLSQAKSGAAGNKACVADLKRAFAVLGISF